MSKYSVFFFPVGFLNFHQAQYLLGFNFQLNRYHTLGWLKAETLIEVASRIDDVHSWKREMIKSAEKAEAEDRLRDACILYRAAEFYTNPTDPDKDRL